MEQAKIGGRQPAGIAVKAGKSYFWCACGKSSRQPFCDGSHKGGPFNPVKYVPTADDTVFFCCCKQTGNAPLCDGSHNTLPPDTGETS